MSTWIREGAKVICLKEHWRHVSGDNPRAATPKHQEECTIAGVQVLADSRLYLRLEGYAKSSLFLSEHFRPATFRDLNIAGSP